MNNKRRNKNKIEHGERTIRFLNSTLHSNEDLKCAKTYVQIYYTKYTYISAEVYFCAKQK